jgi:integral membrane protein (TIGR01906 family)
VRAVVIVLAVLIAVSLPAMLIVNGFRVLATDAFVGWELRRDGFPPDPYGLATEQRVALARTGLASIEPGSEGIALLERATLPDGSGAFQEREVSHMRDVRTLFDAALRLQLIAALAIAALALVLLRTRLRTAVPAGLLAGSLATLGIALLLVPLILFGFDGFFTRFHEIFFSGDSWLFADSDTLIRIYPERFWTDVSRYTAAMTVAQALVLAPLSWWWLRAARRRNA